MASALYPSYKQSALSLSPSVDLDSDTIKVALVNTTTDYTYSAAHNMLDDVVTYSGTTDQTLASKTVTNGVFDADNNTFSTVARVATKDVEALIVYKDTGTPATSPLIAYIDGFTPVVPNGGDITVTWDSNIFAL